MQHLPTSGWQKCALSDVLCCKLVATRWLSNAYALTWDVLDRSIRGQAFRESLRIGHLMKFMSAEERSRSRGIVGYETWVRVLRMPVFRGARRRPWESHGTNKNGEQCDSETKGAKDNHLNESGRSLSRTSVALRETNSRLI